jgi:alpha-ketoglutarate-dependent taurine dioxygenase
LSDPAETRNKVLQTLERFQAMVAARDPAILSEFSDEADVRLVGSEANEVATGPAELEALVRRFFELPVQIRWEWQSRDVSFVGNIAWIFAQGDAVLRGEGMEQRVPYRMTGVLERRGDTWRWRHFHGSEPIPDR